MRKSIQSSGFKTNLGNLGVYGLTNRNNLVESWVSNFRPNTNLNSVRFNIHQPQV